MPLQAQPGGSLHTCSEYPGTTSQGPDVGVAWLQYPLSPVVTSERLAHAGEKTAVLTTQITTVG